MASLVGGRQRVRPVAGALLLCAVGCTAAPRGAAPLPQPSVARPRISLEVRDRPVAEVLQSIAGLAGRQVEVGPSVLGSLSCRLRDVPWDLAFEAVVTAVDGYAVWQRRHGLSVTREAGGGEPFEPLKQPAPPITWARTGAAKSGEAEGRRVEVDRGPCDLSDVLRAISEQAGVPIVLADEISETVHVRFDEVPWREAVTLAAQAGRCEVAPFEVDGQQGLRVGRPAPVAIQLTDVPVRRLLQLLASYARLNLVIAPDVAGSLTVDLRRTAGWTWVGLLETAARAAGLSAGRKGDLVLVSARRVGWGDPDLDGRPLQRRPRPQLGAPPTRLQARGVPAETWLLLLAARADRDVMLRGSVRGTIDADLRQVDAHSALLRSATKHLVRLAEEGTLVRLVPPRRPLVRARSFSPSQVTLNGVAFAIQATAIDRRPDAPPDVAVISGQIYRVGDALRDGQGRALPLALAAIDEDRVAFLVPGRGRVEVAFPPREGR